jgi:hypothetical protein
MPMISIGWDQIMDLVGGIKHMENRLGGRRPDHGKGEHAQKNTRNEAPIDEHSAALADHPATVGDIWVGRKVDTTA